MKLMVLALDIFLNNQLSCLHQQDHQTEKPTELARGQLNMNSISQAYSLFSNVMCIFSFHLSNPNEIALPIMSGFH